jgi:hypothetical protein
MDESATEDISMRRGEEISPVIDCLNSYYFDSPVISGHLKTMFDLLTAMEVLFISSAPF